MAERFSGEPPFCVLTVDVEEWFHRNDMDLPPRLYGGTEGRVVDNTRRLIDILGRNHSKATFFILGEVAERYPEVTRMVAGEGHEVAAHGYEHRLVRRRAPDDFRADARRVKELLEKQSGTRVYGFRAPAWSIGEGSSWAWDVLKEEGFGYDSSLAAKRLGRERKDGHDRTSWFLLPNALPEFPPSRLRMGFFEMPFGGFGFRALPLFFLKARLHAILRRRFVPVVYMHPWELDPEFAYPSGLGFKRRALLRAKRLGMGNCAGKLRDFLHEFPSRSMKECLAGAGALNAAALS